MTLGSSAMAYTLISMPPEFGADHALDYYSKGRFPLAIKLWTDAAAAKGKRDGRRRLVALLNLAAVNHQTGHATLAQRALDDAADMPASAYTPALTAKYQELKGVLQTSEGELKSAQELLEKTVRLALSLNDPAVLSSAQLSLGKLYLRSGNAAEAARQLENSATSAARARDALAVQKARYYQMLTSLMAGETNVARTVFGDSMKQLATLPPSHEAGMLILGFTRAVDAFPSGAPATHDDRLKWTESAQKMAKELGDDWLGTYAAGLGGELRSRTGDLAGAAAETQRAIHHAQKAELPDALFRWEWNLARLARLEKDDTRAIAAYRRAIESFQPVQHDVLIAWSKTGQNSFRSAFAPLFYEAAETLLDLAAREPEGSKKQSLLREARATMELLKNAELQDYFRDECVNIAQAKAATIDTISPRTAVLYIIPLPARTELLLSIGDRLSSFPVSVKEQELTETVHTFRQRLEDRSSHEYLIPSWRLYDWLVRPLEGTLESNGVSTLVFVPDGALRNIPPGALHDGTNFLVQKYAVAVTPGLTLMDPKPVAAAQGGILLNGLSESVRQYPALAYVPNELASVRKVFPGRTLMDRQFVLPRVEKEFENQPYSIIHIASHGEFKGTAADTYLVAYDADLSLDNLERLIKPRQFRGRPLELLTLSACQTAAGDDRAALGLAGVALKAGARSALATLWSVNDEAATSLVSEFYGGLHRPNTKKEASVLSKARALQNAQLKLLETPAYDHPAYWSPFLIIGNWL